MTIPLTSSFYLIGYQDRSSRVRSSRVRSDQVRSSQVGSGQAIPIAVCWLGHLHRCLPQLSSVLGHSYAGHCRFFRPNIHIIFIVKCSLSLDDLNLSVPPPLSASPFEPVYLTSSSRVETIMASFFRLCQAAVQIPRSSFWLLPALMHLCGSRPISKAIIFFPNCLPSSTPYTCTGLLRHPASSSAESLYCPSPLYFSICGSTGPFEPSRWPTRSGLCCWSHLFVNRRS